MLHSYQHKFKEAVLSNDFDEIKDFLLLEDNGVDQTKRFSIYRNTIFVSLIETLKAAFPTVVRLVGVENFTVLARGFIQQSLPQLAYLSSYGGKFPKFLTTLDHVVDDIPYLSDVASLDWVRQKAYFAEDSSILEYDKIKTLKPEILFSSVIMLNPSVELFQTNFPVSHLLKTKEIHIKDLSPEPEYILTYRMENDENIQSIQLEEATFHFLSQLKSGETLGDAYFSTIEIENNFDLQSSLTFSFKCNLYSQICA